MATLGEITQGWTGRLAFTLLETIDGVPTPFAIDPSWDVTLLLRGQDQNGYVEVSGDVTPDGDQGTNPGKVYLDLDADDLDWELSPYDARFQVTDDQSKDVFFPSGKADQLFVHRP